jgi:HEAT repeat protein
MSDSDPAARAAAVRGLRGTGSVEAMAKLGSVDYTRLIHDPAPMVRQAVVQNLLSESAEVYFGHDRAVSEQAIAVALAARSGSAADPALAAKLLSEVSTESVGSQVVAELLSLLDAPAEPSLAVLRASIVTALGGVPSSESARVATRLIDLYRQDASREVRRAVLQALVRLEMARAVPLLDALRSVDTGLTAEIDSWQRAIQSGLQEWTLLLREKQRLLPESPQPH